LTGQGVAKTAPVQCAPQCALPAAARRPYTRPALTIFRRVGRVGGAAGASPEGEA
jgi:hypothetical protein